MTNLYICAAIIPIYFVQICFGAPSTFSDATIQEIRTDLEGLHGIHTKMIEDIIITLRKFEDDPMIELMNLALQGDTCTKDTIDLKYIVGIAYRISGEELNRKYQNFSSTVNFNAKQLEVIGNYLNKHHTAERVEHIMKILRAYHNVGSHQQQEADALYFFMSTTKALINGCSTENSTNNRL